MTTPFINLPEEMVHPFTINFGLVTCPADLREVGTYFRKDFKEFVGSELTDVICKARFDISPVWANEFGTDYPEDALSFLPENLRSPHRPRVPVFNFHVHGLIFCQETRDEIRTRLKIRYPGNNRTSVSNPTAIEIYEDGRETGGIQGWAEYAAMEKSGCNLFKDCIEGGKNGFDNVSVYEDYLRLMLKWKRNSRWIKLNDKPNNVERVRIQYGSIDDNSPTTDDCNSRYNRFSINHDRLLLSEFIYKCVNSKLCLVEFKNYNYCAYNASNNFQCDIIRSRYSPYNSRSSFCYTRTSQEAGITGFSIFENCSSCSRPGIDRPP